MESKDMKSTDKQQPIDGTDEIAAEGRWRARYPQLDAALASGIRAPQITQGFDAAVWRRIQAEHQRLARAVLDASRTARARVSLWMTLINWLGLATAGSAVVWVMGTSVTSPYVLSMVAGGVVLFAGAWQSPPLRRLSRSLF